MNPAFETVENEVLGWTSQDRVLLAERIFSSLEDFSKPELKQNWENEVQRRIQSIVKGEVDGMDAQLVLKKARESLNA
jgi:hypothetical protein